MERGVGCEPVELRVIGEYRLSVQPVGVSALDGMYHDAVAARMFQYHARVNGLCGRCPGHDHLSGRVIAPGEMNLLGSTIAEPPDARLAKQRQRGGGGAAGAAEEIAPRERLVGRFTSRNAFVIRCRVCHTSEVYQVRERRAARSTVIPRASSADSVAPYPNTSPRWPGFARK